MSIGETLAAARRDAGLTVTQVSDATRIRETIIHAIEDDDFSLCGGHFYARGHIRSIAKVVGTDPAPLVASYDAAHGGSPSAPHTAPTMEAKPVSFPERRRPNWSAAMVVALVLVLGFGVYRIATGSSDSGHDGIRTSASAAATASATPSDTPTPDPSKSAGPPVALAPHDEVRVRVKAHDTTWMSASTVSGKELFRGILHEGDTKSWSDDKEIRLVVGNAAGVSLTVNGKELGTPGGHGDVKHLKFGPGDPGAG